MLVCFRYLEFALLGGKCFSEPFYSLLCLHNPLIRAARRQKLEQSCQFWGVILAGFRSYLLLFSPICWLDSFLETDWESLRET